MPFYKCNSFPLSYQAALRKDGPTLPAVYNEKNIFYYFMFAKCSTFRELPSSRPISVQYDLFIVLKRSLNNSMMLLIFLN